jgi:hypothetical protein
LIRKPTFENLPSWVFNQTSGFAHIDGGIATLRNKDNSPITNTHEDFLMLDHFFAPMLNMLVFSSSTKSPSIETTILLGWKGLTFQKLSSKVG